MNKKNRKTIHGIMGLEYIVFTNVPIRNTDYGEAIDLKPHVLELLAARAIIANRIPLRGREVKFLRKALGFSLERLASEIRLTSGSIFKWERALDERLHPINEVALRSYMAEQLGIDLPGKYSELLGTKSETKELILKAS